MNEEQKNIETCLPEDILSEVANVPQDPQFRSLVEESFDPLQQQAAAQAGYDGYIKVAGTHQPYTFTSQVKQMKSNLILLLRRLWRFPFGRGTTASSAAGSSASDAAAGTTAASASAPIRSLADMWQHYITRLKGNSEYGIPSRLSDLTDLPSAPALLADRKICDLGNCPDGISFAQMACKQNEDITEIIDNNEPWGVYGNAFPFGAFPNLKKIRINCESIDVVNFINGTSVEEVEMPFLKRAVSRYYTAFVINNNHIKKLYFPSLEVTNEENGYPLIRACSELEELLIPASKNIANYVNHSILGSVPKIRKIVCDTTGHNSYANSDAFFGNPSAKPNTNPDLIHIEFGAGGTLLAYSTNLIQWSPTNALDASRTDLIEEGSTATNNLQQFLSNFKTYIAERLTDKGKGLTLTLSQEVRDAIEGDPTIAQIITSKGWTISPAPTA